MVYREWRTPEQIERADHAAELVIAQLALAPKKIFENLTYPPDVQPFDASPEPDTVILDSIENPENQQ